MIEKVRYESSIQDDDKIHVCRFVLDNQDPLDDLINRQIIWEIKTLDKHIRRQLINLGWTPPKKIPGPEQATGEG